MTKFGWKYYFKPTPQRVRIWGNSIFAASMTAAGFSFITDHKWLGGSIIVLGFIGKFISNFFADEVDDTDTGSGGV